jgi:GxxExxY protein
MIPSSEADRGLTAEVLEAIKEVYSVLGYGMHEGIYQGALEVEFGRREIPARSRQELPVRYKGQILKKRYRPDFVLYDRIVLEIASAPALTQDDEALLRSHLRVCGVRQGILANFGAPRLEYRGIVL